MPRWRVEPEVAGQLGEDSVLDHSTTPFTVQVLHYDFDGWLGDDLVETTPCFLVTDLLAAALRNSDLSGWVLDDLKVTTSEVFEELYPGKDLPEFRWLKVVGATSDDFCLDRRHRLEVSDRALQLLKEFSIGNADIKEVQE